MTLKELERQRKGQMLFNLAIMVLLFAVTVSLCLVLACGKGGPSARTAATAVVEGDSH